MGFFLNFVYTLLECNHIGQSPGTALPIQFATSGNAICLPSINLDKHCGGRREFKQNYLSIVSENQFCFHQKDIFFKVLWFGPKFNALFKKNFSTYNFFFQSALPQWFMRFYTSIYKRTQKQARATRAWAVIEIKILKLLKFYLYTQIEMKIF